MRLRITVRRHGLPETPVILPIDTQTSTPTVSKLLEEVNDLIPIESGEWGLEDYAVEVKGNNGVNYECLHYQEVGNVMKEEDEVIIRPLLTQDLKVRRISGRRQISSDGRHLVDGIPFGRPLLRRPADRPAVNIPPRKRRRITYTEDEEDDEGLLTLKDKEAFGMEESSTDENNNRELVIHADFDDDEDEDDEDFALGEDEDLEESDDEDEDSEGEDDEPMKNEEKEELFEPEEAEIETDKDDELALADVLDESTRAKIRKLHSVFPDSAMAVCKHVLNGTYGDEAEAYEALTRGFRPVKPKSAITETSENQTDLTVPKTRSSRTAATKKPEALDSMEVEANETQDSLLDYYDRNGLPEGSITSGRALAVMADAVKNSPTPSLRPNSRGSISGTSNKSVRFALQESLSNGLTSTPFVDHESYERERDASDEDTSTSGSDSSSDDESDSAKPTNTSSSGGDSDNSSDSSSDDSAAPEETSSKLKAAQSPNVNNKSRSSTGGVNEKTRTQPKSIVPPGQGQKATRARNQRRKIANALSKSREKGILPADTTASEFSQLEDLTSNTSPDDVLAALTALRASKHAAEVNEATCRALAKAEEFEARRQALLASLASGGIEVGQESLKRESKPPPTTHASMIETASLVSPLKEVVYAQPGAVTFSTALEIGQQPSNPELIELEISENSSEMRPSTALEVPTATTPSASPKATAASAESTQNSSTSSRRRLDLGAGRRLLFGALGIKNPETKQDEEKVRNDLMKDVRPLKTAETPEMLPKANEESINEDPEAWREKVTYRAVECCHDGVELSEPPFPFVQRWDPQQQGSWPNKGDRGGKRKKNQRDQDQYYNDDPRASKKQRRRKGKHNYAEEQQEYLDATYEPSFQDATMDSQYEDQTQTPRLQSDDFEGEISQQLMNDLKSPSAETSQGPADLAFLPEDPTSLPDLKDGDAKVGMTIAFKQLVLSAETKWQPQISVYRTAIVIASPESGELHLTLAMRDRVQPEKKYDEGTGERVYDKFDMPEDEDDMEPEDDGMLNLSFSELVEPKIVQLPPADLNTARDSDGAPEANVGSNLDESVTLSHEEEAAEAQLSHVTETSLHSEAPEPNVAEGSVEKENHDHASDDVEEDVNTEDVNTEDVEEPVTPALRGGHVPAVDMDIPTDPISDENREQISRLMRDAGFRSSVPSSVLRDIRPDGMNSPGDAAVFEKLLKDMTEIQNPPYSPKFNGLGSSSPIRKQQTVLQSPSPEEGLPPRKESEHIRSSSPADEIAELQTRVDQSSWETVDPEDEPASSPIMATDEASSWVTEERSSPPVRGPVKRTSNVKAPKKVPISKAQAMWQALQPENRRTSVDSAESSKTSPGPPILLDGANEKDSNESIQYPKLSVGSSFTSNVADHGRQPDFNFEDSTEGNVADTPKVAETDVDFEPELPPPKSRKSLKQVDHVLSSSPELRYHKSIDDRLEELLGSPKNVPEVQDDAPSSDDPFPTLEEVFSQRGTKLEKKTPTPPKVNKVEKAYRKAMAALSDDESAEEADQTTPKASQNHTRASKSRPVDKRVSQNRASQSRGSQSRTTVTRPSRPRASQSQSKFVLPQGSQVMDLTLSSDVEVEEEVVDVSRLDLDDAFMRDFNEYDDPDDDDFEDEGGWVPKKASAMKGVETRRQTSVGLRASSQASLNSRNRRTTAAE